MSEQSAVRKVRTGLLAGMLTLAAMTIPAFAGGGNVLPSNAQPKGYSLDDAAAATAQFNTGPHSATPPSLPFYTVADDATVKPGTFLYIPVFYTDDSGTPDPLPFPADISDRDAAADYLIDSLNAYIHHVQGLPDSVIISDLLIEVDGQDTVLDDSYVGTATTAPLQDGGGTHYIVSGAFLTPLTPGKHAIGIGGVINGHNVVFFENTVTVTNK